jgi:hypothetical protein
MRVERETYSAALKKFSELADKTKELSEPIAWQLSYNNTVDAYRYFEASHVRSGSLIVIYPMISDYLKTMTLIAGDSCLLRAELSAIEHTEEKAIEEMQQMLANYTDVQNQFINKNNSLMNELIDLIVGRYPTGFYP